MILAVLLKKTNYNAKMLSLDGEIVKINFNMNSLFDLKLRQPIETIFILLLGNTLFNSEDGNQSYLIFQAVYKYFKTISNSVYISEWKSKGLSDESIKPPKTTNNVLTPQLNYYGAWPIVTPFCVNLTQKTIFKRFNQLFLEPLDCSTRY